MASAAEPDVPVTARAPIPDLLDEVPVGVFLTDEDLRLVWANPRVGELTGVQLDRPPHELLADEAEQVAAEVIGGRVGVLEDRVDERTEGRAHGQRGHRRRDRGGSRARVDVGTDVLGGDLGVLVRNDLGLGQGRRGVRSAGRGE